ECDGHGIECAGLEGDFQRIRFNCSDWTIKAQAASFGKGADQHGMAKIGSHYRQLQALVKLNREVPGTAAEIETEAGLNTADEFLHLLCGKLSPFLVDGYGKKVVQEVVSVRDLPKHLPDHPAFGAAVGGYCKFFTGGLCFHRSGLSPFLEPIPAER